MLAWGRRGAQGGAAAMVDRDPMRTRRNAGDERLRNDRIWPAWESQHLACQARRRLFRIDDSDEQAEVARASSWIRAWRSRRRSNLNRAARGGTTDARR